MKYYQNKKVLVTGGSGFVGVNLLLKLLESGAIISATYHKNPPIVNNNMIRYIKCDLTNKDECDEVVKGIDNIFMCAANTSGAAIIESSPLIHLSPNIVMNVNMLDAAYNAGVKKFLFVSSSIVYPPNEIPMKEDYVNNEYFSKYYIAAWMKRFSEIVCDIYATKVKNPMHTIVVRPGNFYGAYDDFAWETSHVIPALIRKVVERQSPLEIWGDGNDVKDFIYIDDFVEGMLLAMANLKDSGPINIASGISSTINEIIDYIIEIDGYNNVEVVYNRSKPTMIPKRLIDTTKAKTLLGFQSKTTLKDGLRRTIKWYKESKTLGV